MSPGLGRSHGWITGDEVEIGSISVKHSASAAYFSSPASNARFLSLIR